MSPKGSAFMKYRVNEIFYSIQGEGPYMGVPTVFIRFAGCNLTCSWCDTEYAREDGEERTIEEIIQLVEQEPECDVCLTGGEPLLQKNLEQLAKMLLKGGHRLLLETNGSISVKNFIKATGNRKNIIISMDVKTPSSREENSFLEENLELLENQDVLKFIVADRFDMNFTKMFLENKHIKCHVLVQPMGKADRAKIVEMFLGVKWPEGLDVRFGLQIHKIIWNAEKRGV